MTKTAKSYIDSLDYTEFSKIRPLKDSGDFYQFLAEPCKVPVVIATFAAQCKNFGIPETYTNSSEMLHYLVVAINSRVSGNA